MFGDGSKPLLTPSPPRRLPRILCSSPPVVRCGGVCGCIVVVLVVTMAVNWKLVMLCWGGEMLQLGLRMELCG